MNRLVAGIDLGGTNISAGIASPSLPDEGVAGAMLGRGRKKTKPELGPEGVIGRVAEAVEIALEQAGSAPEDLATIGIGAPGVIDRQRGVVVEAVNLRWNDVPLGDMLNERFGVPVVVDNDVNVAVLGEDRLGAGERAAHLLGVWVGTGIGGGLILDGKLHYGAFGSAGEIGHVHAQPYNQPGGRSVEHNCSRTALADRLTKLIKANRPSIIPELVEGDLSRIRSRIIAEAYARGDALTRDVVDSAADLLGIIVGGAVTLLSLERVVLGGGLTEALGEPFVDLVRAGARRVIFPNAAKNVEIVASELSDDAGIAGAALLAIESIHEPEPTA